MTMDSTNYNSSALGVTAAGVSALHVDVLNQLNNGELGSIEQIQAAFVVWIENNIEGFCIRDLDVVMDITEKLFEWLDTQYYDFVEIAEKFLLVCSKPLIELKANERLSLRGYERIRQFFSTLCVLWRIAATPLKIKIGKCFRCIIHGGKDPTKLSTDHVEWISDGVQQKLTDRSLIYKMFRDAEVLPSVAEEFIAAAELLNYQIEDPALAGSSVIQSGGELGVNIASTMSPEELRQELAMYGIPLESANAPADDDAGDAEQKDTIGAMPEDQFNAVRSASKLGYAELSTVHESHGEDDISVAVGGEDTTAASAALVVGEEEEKNESVKGNDLPQPVSDAAASFSSVKNARNEVANENDRTSVPEISSASLHKTGPSAGKELSEIEGRQEPAADGLFDEGGDAALLSPTDAELTEDQYPPSPEQDKGNIPRGASTRTNTSGGALVEQNTPALTRELSQMLLDLSLDLSRDQENAAILCSLRVSDGAIVMIQKDAEFNIRDPRIPFSVELIWNVVESFLEMNKIDHSASATAAGGPAVEVATGPTMPFEHLTDPVMDYEQAIHVLHAMLQYRVVEGFRLSDKELRNELVILLSLISEFPGALPYFVVSGALNMFITYACIEETGREAWYFRTKPVANARNFSTVSDIDLEFKKVLWLAISNLLRANDPDTLLCIGSSPMLDCMMLYLEYDSFDPKRQEGSTAGVAGGGGSMASQHDIGLESQQLGGELASSFSAEENKQTGADGKSSIISGAKNPVLAAFPLFKLREFQLLAVNFLVHNAPKILGEFERIDGPARMISVILKYCQSAISEHKTLIFTSLILLNRCLISSLSVRSYMEETNSIQTYLHIFGITKDVEETRAQAVRLISTLCSGQNLYCQRQLRDLGGIPALIRPLSENANNRRPVVGTKAGVKLSIVGDENRIQDPLENPFGGEISILVIAVIDCLSKAVIGNKTSEAEYADHEGIDALLDLLEASPFVLRIQILRLLSDLLRNSRLVSFVNAWRSPKTLRSAAQILCHCWMDEEARLNCSRNTGGVVGGVQSGGVTSGIVLGSTKAAAGATVGGTLGGTSGGNLRAGGGVGAASSGVISDIWNPLGNHQWPFDEEQVMGAAYMTLQAKNALDERSLAASVKSMAVTRLATAILAGRNASQCNLPVSVSSQVLEKDTRVVIASALKSIGVFEMYNIFERSNPFKTAMANETEDQLSPQQRQLQDAERSPAGDSITFSPGKGAMSGSKRFGGGSASGSVAGSSAIGGVITQQLGASTTSASGPAAAGDLGLAFDDKQVLSMAKKYDALREGEWWRSVREMAELAGIVPVEADTALIDAQLEYCFDAAQAVQVEQMEISQEGLRHKKGEENHFVSQLIIKKNQQIKAEWLKRNGKNKSALNPFSRKKGF